MHLSNRRIYFSVSSKVHEDAHLFTQRVWVSLFVQKVWLWRRVLFGKSQALTVSRFRKICSEIKWFLAVIKSLSLCWFLNSGHSQMLKLAQEKNPNPDKAWRFFFFLKLTCRIAGADVSGGVKTKQYSKEIRSWGASHVLLLQEGRTHKPGTVMTL